MYKYWGFGLHIVSEIEFPELLIAAFEVADVRIVLGKISSPTTAEATQNKFGVRLITNDELIFAVKDVAGYHIAKGEIIVVEVDDNNLYLRNVRLFLLATAFAALLLQRNMLPLHASAVVIQDKLVLVAGDSGAGKSTTTAGLAKNGYPIFSDDIVVLQKGESNDVSVTASYPMIKLWDDTLVNLEHEMFDDRSFEIRPGMDKYGIFFHENFITKSYPVSKIFILKKADCTEITHKILHGGKAFSELTNQIYRKGLLRSNHLKKLSFRLLTGLSQTCTIYEITRPENCLAENLLQHVKQLL